MALRVEVHLDFFKRKKRTVKHTYTVFPIISASFPFPNHLIASVCPSLVYHANHATQNPNLINHLTRRPRPLLLLLRLGRRGRPTLLAATRARGRGEAVRIEHRLPPVPSRCPCLLRRRLRRLRRHGLVVERVSLLVKAPLAPAQALLPPVLLELLLGLQRYGHPTADIAAAARAHG
jgi:hypothetical protein